MPMFCKKPVVIEARRLGDGDDGDIIRWCGGRAVGSEDHDSYGSYGTDAMLIITTLEGEMVGRRGDWIIRGVEGEFYPCKTEYFHATYEPVD